MTQNNKTYIDELSDITDSPGISDHQSEVCQYFKGRNVLITGASGFFGILLIEKLLRCCPGITKMYIFMKGKKEKSAEERFKEQFDDVIYDRLRKEQPDFITKLIMMKADFGEVNLGLSPENCKRLLDTNVIFHMAATVRFNESLRNAVNINVRGVKQFLLFARELPNLEAFVHVSTAFSHCVYKSIEEKYYPSPFETDKILKLLDILDDEKLEKITPILVGEWPNTYTYSKAISEDTVRQYGVGLPVCIVRPSIVTTTAKEPVPGWINNIYGAVGIVTGTGLGLLRTLHCAPNNTAEIIPADYVIANVVVASWDVAKRKNNANPDVPETEKTPIYNCVASAQNPITWSKFMKLNEKYGLRVPSMKVIWYYMLILQNYRFLHEICVILLHIIPGAIFDALALLTGQKPVLLKTYKKVKTFTDVISYFTMREWKFHNDTVLRLWNSLNPVDQQIFTFNPQELCWEDYLSHMIPGIRLYIVKESDDTLEAARARFKKLKIAHYTLLTIGSILLVWITATIISFIISFFL